MFENYGKSRDQVLEEHRSKRAEKKVMDELNHRFEKIEKGLGAVQVGQIEMKSKAQNKEAMELLAKIHTATSNYTNLIMAVGYVGLFTLWSELRGELTGIWFAITGLLITFSLLMFIGWELIKMIRGQKAMSKALKSGYNLDQIKIVYDEQESLNAKSWPLFLWPTVMSGLGAGVVLLIFFGKGFL